MGEHEFDRRRRSHLYLVIRWLAKNKNESKKAGRPDVHH
jgi:hypothetical protein